ncbi:MAG: lipid-A-disaccharide synthase [Oligoflexia bacterium]|nr:lipid-A-disaccharide synthase [Oligoflexia bacterium]
MSTPHITICAGELSGDEHAAEVALALREQIPHAKFTGMGGRHLRRAGVETLVDSEKDGSVMGFGDVLRALPRIRRSLSLMQEHLRQSGPDLLILVDYPDFNLRLAKTAKQLGLRVLYYIPPSVWAWRPKRLELLRKYTDSIALIYPFEESFYAGRGMAAAKFVGHPLVDRAAHYRPDPKLRSEVLQALNFAPELPTLLIMPGSRDKELQRHLPIVIATLSLLQARCANIQVIVSEAPTVSLSKWRSELEAIPRVRVASRPSVDLLRACDAGLLKSGTSNLQAAFAGLPSAMFFRTSWLSELIVRKLVKVREFSIVNLIRPATFKEYLQAAANPAELAAECQALLFDQGYRAKIQAHLVEVVERLSPPQKDTRKAAQRVAALAQALLS